MKNWFRRAVIWSLALSFFAADGAVAASEDSQKSLVLVAGATGRTGEDIVKQLLAENYRVRGLVRDRVKAEQMFGSSIEYAVGDVRETATLPAAMKGAAYVVCAIGSTRGDPTNSPEQVDYRGVANLADAARAAGVRQFVLMSAMGVTHPDEMLRQGRERPSGPGLPPPGLLELKLKGENHLRASGLNYTIVRSAGLARVPGGQQGIKAEQGDKPRDSKAPLAMISREDIATVLVKALGNPDAYGKTFEVMSDAATQSVDWANFFKRLVKDRN